MIRVFARQAALGFVAGIVLVLGAGVGCVIAGRVEDARIARGKGQALHRVWS